MRNTARFLLLLVLLVSIGEGCRRKGPGPSPGPYLGPAPAQAVEHAPQDVSLGRTATRLSGRMHAPPMATHH